MGVFGERSEDELHARPGHGLGETSSKLTGSGSGHDDPKAHCGARPAPLGRGRHLVRVARTAGHDGPNCRRTARRRDRAPAGTGSCQLRRGCACRPPRRRTRQLAVPRGRPGQRCFLRRHRGSRHRDRGRTTVDLTKILDPPLALGAGYASARRRAHAEVGPAGPEQAGT